MTNSKVIDKLSELSMKIGSMTYLMVIRDAFASIMPLFILAGIAVLVNNVVFPWFLEGDALASAQVWGNLVGNGTMNIAGLLIGPMITYHLCSKKDFSNTVLAIVVTIASLIVIMPLNMNIAPVGSEDAVTVTGILTYGNLGTSGMFSGIIIGLLSTTIFIKLSQSEKLKINLGENIPEMVGRSFSSLIPIVLTVSFFALIGTLLQVFLDTNLIDIIKVIIQEPFRKLSTNLVGYLVITSFGTLLFFFGIHQGVVNEVLVYPFLLVNINENMLALQNGTVPEHILTYSFHNAYASMGGTGCTLALLAATFLFSKSKFSKNIAKLSFAPGVFNINEPVIFGYPIIYNFSLLIPFVFVPVINVIIAYFATAVGLVNKMSIMLPWTTPPFVSGYLGTGGDWRGTVLQIFLFILDIAIWLVFMKMHEKVQSRQAQLEQN